VKEAKIETIITKFANILRPNDLTTTAKRGATVYIYVQRSRVRTLNAAVNCNLQVQDSVPNRAML